MVWWLRPWCVFMRFWVQCLMNVCLNVFGINVDYKHIHHGEYIDIVHHGDGFKTFLLKKLEKKIINFFSWHVSLSQYAMIKIQSVTPLSKNTHTHTCTHEKKH